ncbi:DUF932 domain-containing protein [Streptomyces sp. NPDC058595]|uniref:DUF932 domain-containing protein n=1 Tax=Streptomyces sp. NPDC058595 TaxID=3346550 RepID=UPI00364E4D70
MTQQLIERAAAITRDTARNASLDDLATILESQQDRKLDVVTAASALRAEAGNLIVQGVPPLLRDDAVVSVDGVYRPTGVGDEGIAEKLRIPVSYLRRMREEAPPLYDANVNGWLAQDPDRRFLLRALRADSTPGAEQRIGVARALVSPSYKVIDNLDILMAALDGIKESGHNAEITRCDLTDRRMYVRVESEQVRIAAPALLSGYRSPFTGQTGDELPIMSAGFIITNSETGGGAYTVCPCATIQVCTNGVTMTEDLMRTVHIGGKQDDGIVDPSAATQRAVLSVVMNKTRDAVDHFLSADYLETKLRQIEADAGRPVTNPAQTVEDVTKQLNISKERRDTILDHFIRGGQLTAGGVMQAITSTAQTLTNADQAYELEALALPALRTAAKFAQAA